MMEGLGWIFLEGGSSVVRGGSWKGWFLALCLLGSFRLAAQEPAPAAPSSGLAARVLEKAKDYLGVPYRRGGNGPTSFDCSGYVRFVFGHFGFDLNRSSHAQATQGIPVAPDALQPGDLLFFRTLGRKSRISHVGIYLGEKLFIHAGSWGGRAGRRVKLGELERGYYAQRFVAARRVLPESEIPSVDASQPSAP